MRDLPTLVKALDTGIWEMGEAFKGLEDKDVWIRPHPRLLSIGEVAAHVALWEAITFFGMEFESVLFRANARYYPVTIEEPLVLPLGSEEVYKEVQRIHEACKAAFLAEPPSDETPNPHREGWTWGTILEYQVFHIAYHTGQIYSLRHMMGHETVDN